MKNIKFLIAVFCLMLFVLADATSASTITINPDKTLNLNGKKTFPIAAYYICSYNEIYESCNTSIGVNSNFTMSIQERAWKPINFNARGIWHTTSHPLSSSPDVTSGNYFLGYYVDEPDLNYPERGTESQHRSYYTANHSTQHLFIVGLAGGTFTQWHDTSDVFSWDQYPLDTLYMNNNWGNDKCEGKSILYNRNQFLWAWEKTFHRQSLNCADDVNDIPKPIWVYVQANGITELGGRILIPTVTEIRAQAYTAITWDIKGLQFYKYKDNLELNPALRAYVNELAGELNSLNNILVLPTKAFLWRYKKNNAVIFSNDPTENMQGESLSSFNYILKQDGSVYYLIVVNKNPLSVTTDITLSDIPASMSVRSIGNTNAGSIAYRSTLTNGKFSDTFAGHAAHIYQIYPYGTTPPEYSIPNTPSHCSNNVKDFDETGIDCGGSCSACSSSPTSLSLKSGWNQISSPVAAGINLATIEQSCTILPYKNQKLWSWNATSQVWINPTKVEPFRGYWIYAAYQCTVPLSGTSASFTTLQLSNGWNKISAAGTLSAIAGTCANHIVSNWIWNWEKAAEKWIHPTAMQLDKGYWIKVDQNCVFGG